MELERLLYLFIVTNCVVLQCITSSHVTFLRESRASYLAARQSFLDAEKRMKIGGNLTLSVKEETANKILMGYKISEINASRNGVPFPPSMHFFKGKPLIQKSKVFKILSKMPKGEWLLFFYLMFTKIYIFCFGRLSVYQNRICKFQLKVY